MRTVQNQTRKQVLRFLAMPREELPKQLLYDSKCGRLEEDEPMRRNNLFDEARDWIMVILTGREGPVCGTPRQSTVL